MNGKLTRRPGAITGLGAFGCSGFTTQAGVCAECLAGERAVLGVPRAAAAFSSLDFSLDLPRSFLPTEDGQPHPASPAGPAGHLVRRHAGFAAPGGGVKANPDVAHVTFDAGRRPSSSTFNSGSMFVQLKPRGGIAMEQTLASLRAALAENCQPAILHNTRPRPCASGGRSAHKGGIGVVRSVARRRRRPPMNHRELASAMRARPQTFVDVASDLQNSALQGHIDVGHDRANARRLPPPRCATRWRPPSGTLVMTEIQSTGNSYDVI